MNLSKQEFFQLYDEKDPNLNFLIEKWYNQYLFNPKNYHNRFLHQHLILMYDQWLHERKLNILEQTIEIVGKD